MNSEKSSLRIMHSRGFFARNAWQSRTCVDDVAKVPEPTNRIRIESSLTRLRLKGQDDF